MIAIASPAVSVESYDVIDILGCKLLDYGIEDCSTNGYTGVGGMLSCCRLRFQKPALGPRITNASVHRLNPRSESG